MLQFDQYDRTIIAFSGGKDSLACVLWAIENGLPNIELWHHDVDGREEVPGQVQMDWPSTREYCKTVAKELGLPIYFSWLEGGFHREMHRNDQRKARTFFETPDGLKCAGGTRGKLGTRMKFPQVSADLKVRWCSAYLKIDVCSTTICNQARFDRSKTLLITGERAEESASRAKYKQFEPDRADNRDGKKHRHVDRLRPIHGWLETQVWEIIERHRIQPHPAYRLGWGRLSCMTCIFGSPNQWASVKQIAPQRFARIAAKEQEFGLTIKRNESVEALASKGNAYAMDSDTIAEALSTAPIESVRVDNWQLPVGAFGENAGPT